MTLAVPNEHFQDSEEIPDVQFNLPEDVITNDFPLFRPPEMENTGYKEIEDYVDYDAYNMIGARAKKLPNGDKVCFATELNQRSEVHGRRTKSLISQHFSRAINFVLFAKLTKNFDDLVEMLDYYNDEWDVKSEASLQLKHRNYSGLRSVVLKTEVKC